MIPYGRQQIDESDIEAVVEALRSDYLTTGPLVAKFEEAFAAMVGAKHAVAVCNGTAALHLAMLVAGIGPNDRVVTSPNTFLASANCAAYVGAIPDFCDIDPISYTLCPRALVETWKPDTRAVVAVDFGGQTADMPAIAEVARQNNAIVIEDACHAIGGKFEHQGKIYSVGAHPWADITTFSFHPVKTMTTGEGGMLVTDNDKYAARARSLRSHGMTREPGQFIGLADALSSDSPFAEQGPWYYEMLELGFNFRITDLQCALGISQLKRLDGFVARRREIVARYDEAFASLPNVKIPRLPHSRGASLASWHLYTLQVDFQKFGMTRTKLMAELRKANVGSQVLYIPVYLQPWYRITYGYKQGKCPIAEAYYLKAITLPLFPMMLDEEVEQVISVVRELAATASSCKTEGTQPVQRQ